MTGQGTSTVHLSELEVLPRPRVVWAASMAAGRQEILRHCAQAGHLPTHLPGSRLLQVVGGVNDSGKAGYHVADEPEYDNPSYEIYNPKTRCGCSGLSDAQV